MVYLHNAKIRTVKRQRQIRYNHQSDGLENLNGFAFKVSSNRLELVYLKDALPVYHYAITILDTELLVELMHQPVMRIEEVHNNGEEFAFIAVNANLIANQG